MCVPCEAQGGGGGRGCRKLQWGGGAAVDRDEADEGERVKKEKRKRKLKEEDTFPRNSVRGGDPPVASGAQSPFTLKCLGTVTRGVKVK